MKKLLIYIIISTGLLAGSCKDFLDLPPKNQRAVQSLNDVKSVLAGYLDSFVRSNTRPVVGPYPIITAHQNMMFEAYADNFDIEANMPRYIASNNSHANEKFYADKLLFNDTETPAYIWTNYYAAIGFLNALIDQCDDLNDADPAELKRVKGEMLVHRAYYAFKLQQYFAPMDDEAMGIPLYLHTGQEVVGVEMRRLAQAEVYRIIIDDLTQALAYSEEVGSNQGYNVFFKTRYIHNLLAQVYWFKAESVAKHAADYTHARDYALAAVQGAEAYIPKTLVEFQSIQRNLNPDYPAFYMQGSGYGEVAAMYGSPWDYIGFSPSNLAVSPDLLALFDDTDYRKAAYFNNNLLSSAWPDGAAFGTKYVKIHLFTPEEAYLILAESYFRLNQEAQALDALNEFKTFRQAEEKSQLTGTALLNEIVQERRKEFFADTDKRWLDLKRYKMKNIERTLTFFGNSYNVNVQAGDYHYALPIPLVELQENPHIKPNDGWNPIVF